MWYNIIKETDSINAGGAIIMNREISDSFLDTVNGGADMKAMYEYCCNWTCKHCGKTADGHAK